MNETYYWIHESTDLDQGIYGTYRTQYGIPVARIIKRRDIYYVKQLAMFALIPFESYEIARQYIEAWFKGAIPENERSHHMNIMVELDIPCDRCGRKNCDGFC